MNSKIVNTYEIWLEGYKCTGNDSDATYYGNIKATTFKDACKHLMNDKDWDLNLYNDKNNSYWSCKFYDNEIDARDSFG